MKPDFFKSILSIAVYAVCCYWIHFFLFSFYGLNHNSANFRYSLVFLYVYFCSFSVAILLILQQVKKKNFDVVGISFMALTTIKIVVSYAVIFPVVEKSPDVLSLEKMNFFGIFALFLAIETIHTIRNLNYK